MPEIATAWVTLAVSAEGMQRDIRRAINRAADGSEARQTGERIGKDMGQAAEGGFERSFDGRRAGGRVGRETGRAAEDGFDRSFDGRRLGRDAGQDVGRGFEGRQRGREAGREFERGFREAVRAGGGGGGGNGGFFGDLFKGAGGGGRFATSASGLNLGALVVGSFPAAATAATNLAGALQQVAQAGLVLPGVIAGAATSLGTAAVGFQGVGDAISTMWEAAASGDPKDLEKAAEALKGLTPSARNAVGAIARLRPELMGLRDLAQENIFGGLDETISDLAAKALPTLRSGIGEVSSAWNNTFKELGRVGGLDSTQSFLDRIFGNTADAQNRANAAIAPFTHAIGALTAKGTDFLPRIADAIGSAADRFDRFISAADQDGRLGKWIDEGLTGFGQLSETLLNGLKIITSLTKAAGGDGGLLAMLEKGSTKLAEFLGSAEGQEKLSKFFKDGREQLNEWFGILKNVGSILGDVYDGVKQWADVLLPALKTVTDVIDAMPGGISGVVTAFLAWKTITGVRGLLGSLTGIGSALDGLPGKAEKSARGIKGAFRGLRGPGAALGLGVGLDGLSGDPNSLGDGAKTVGGFALTGAALGGLPGAAVGAGVGIVADQIARGEALRKRVEEFNKQVALLDKGDTGGMKALLNAFYGSNVSDPRELVKNIPVGGFAYQGLIDQMSDPNGQFKGLGVNAGNAKATLDRILSNAREVGAALDQLGDKVETLPSGEIVLKDPTPELIQRVEDLGLKVKTLPNGRVAIDVQTDVANNKMRGFIDQWSKAVIAPQLLPANAPGSTGVGKPNNPLDVIAGRANGGSIFGPGGPKSDLIPAMLSNGEHVLTAEDVSAMGGQGAVYAFRNALHRAGGGKIWKTGAIVWPPEPIGPTDKSREGGVPDLRPGKNPNQIGLPDWSTPGQSWGAPPPGWWTKPIDPDDYLLPEWWPPGHDYWKHPYDKNRIKPFGFAGGGAVTVESLKQYASGISGQSYAWGAGDGDTFATDCSGAQATLANYITGANGRFSTASESQALLARGFQQGDPPPGIAAYWVGWKNGGPGGGHTAGTILDPEGGNVNVEMGGRGGNGQFGGGAAGASEFPNRAWIALSGYGDDPSKSSGGSTAAVKSASASVTSAKASTSAAQNAVDKANADLDKLKAEGASADKISAAEKKRDVADQKLTAAQERQSAAETRLSEVKDKEASKAEKSSSGGSGAQGFGQQLASGLFGGLMESIGLPGFSNILDWPLVKSGTAALNAFAGPIKGALEGKLGIQQPGWSPGQPIGEDGNVVGLPGGGGGSLPGIQMPGVGDFLKPIPDAGLQTKDHAGSGAAPGPLGAPGGGPSFVVNGNVGMDPKALTQNFQAKQNESYRRNLAGVRPK